MIFLNEALRRVGIEPRYLGENGQGSLLWLERNGRRVLAVVPVDAFQKHGLAVGIDAFTAGVRVGMDIEE